MLENRERGIPEGEMTPNPPKTSLGAVLEAFIRELGSAVEVACVWMTERAEQ